MEYEATLKQIMQKLAEALNYHKMTISAAESCTGGLVAKLITDMPGSSAYFKGSAVTYCNEAKQNILHVNQASLLKYTAVSRAVAQEMAMGSREIYHSDIAVSTTGYAGPGLGELGERAGLVYIAVAGAKDCHVYKEQFLGSRFNIRQKAAEKAIRYMLEYILLK